MTSPPEQIMVKCPKCNETYGDWWRPSINMSLGEEFDEEYLDEAGSSTCPHCNYKVYHDVLTVREDGVFETGPRGEDGPSIESDS